MMIFPLFKKIEKSVIISEKYGILMSNLDLENKKYIYKKIKEELDDIAEKSSKSTAQILGELFNSNYYCELFSKYNEYEDKVELLCEYIICIYTEEEPTPYLSLKNEFTGNPTWEISNEVKFIELLNFIDRRTYKVPEKKSGQLNSWFNYNHHAVYSGERTKFDIISSMTLYYSAPDIMRKKNPYHFNNYFQQLNVQVNNLLGLGRAVDKYIQGQQDYFLLDYILDIISNNTHSYFSIVSSFSILEAIIVHKNYTSLRQELIKKLPQFVPDYIENKELWVKSIYEIRSKMAHGDYKALQKATEKYFTAFLRHMELDYYEYSRINWIYNATYGDLKNVLANVIWSMLYVRPLITKLRSQKV